MSSGVFVREYQAPPLNRKEILRYMQATSDPATEALLDACLKEALPNLQYRVCYGEFPVTLTARGLDLGFAQTGSKDLAKNLSGCKEVLLFAATVGIGIDRLIARYQRISPAKSLCFSAIGSERIESLCDTFCDEWKIQFSLRPRFSPGYGDLPLELQRDLFRALDCPRKIGLTLNESCLMSPSKSVTALVGKEV